MLLTALRADGGKNAAAARLSDIKHHLADADHFPAIFIPGRRAGDHKVRAKLFYAYAGRAALLQIAQGGLVSQQVRVTVGEGERHRIMALYPAG